MSIYLNDIITYGNAKFQVVRFQTSKDTEYLQNQINDKFDLNDDYTIIYPNNGTEQNPANVTTNNRYVMNNPFPGYFVNCQAEYLYNNEWINPGYTTNNCGSGGYGTGMKASQHNDNYIILQTATDGLTTYSKYQLNTANVNAVVTSAPCRVKVWKIGKI